MGSGIYFPISAISFSLLIITVFFIKKPIKSVETRIYKNLLLVNFVGLVLELLCTVAAYISETHYIISDFILKLYLVYNISFTALLTIYVYYISINNDKKVFKYKNTKFYVTFIYLLSVFIVYVLKCNLVIENNFEVRYTNGSSVTFTYILCGLLIALMVVFILRDKQNIRNKKYIPVLVFIVTLIIGIIIQTNYPGILIMTYIETLTLSIMFHTIENPDIKMLNEVHKAKDISDNANEEKSMFLYNMTNEIRHATKEVDQIANAILDETENKKVNIDVIKDYAREIKNSASRFNSMTNEVLDISHMDSANIRVYNDKYNVKLIIKEIVQIYKNKCIDKNLDFLSDRRVLQIIINSLFFLFD
jgi:signal transduction histidine kinase